MPRPVTGLNSASRTLPDGTRETRWYHIATKQFIGCSKDGWTREMALERAKELSQPKHVGPPSGSFGALCALYLASRRFKSLAPKTQKGYRAHIEVLRGMWELVPLPGITRAAVAELHSLYEDRPWQGNAILRTLRLVMNHGLHKLQVPGITKNPAERSELYDTPARHQVWTEPQIEAFLAVAPPRLRMGFALLLYTVQRGTDVLGMSRPMLFEKNGRTWIRLRQRKTQELVDVPCHRRLSEEMALYASFAVDAHWRTRAIDGSVLLVPSPTGRAWSYRNFARAWDATRRRANWRIAREAIRSRGGLPPTTKPQQRDAVKTEIRAVMLGDLQRRDLRRTGVVQLARAGASIAAIAALAGWRIDHTQKIVDIYLPRRGEVALGGVERWEEMPATVVPLGPARRQKLKVS